MDGKHNIFFNQKEEFKKPNLQQVVGDVQIKIYDKIYTANKDIVIIGGKVLCDGVPMKEELQGTICVTLLSGKKKNGVPGLTYLAE